MTLSNPDKDGKSCLQLSGKQIKEIYKNNKIVTENHGSFTVIRSRESKIERINDESTYNGRCIQTTSNIGFADYYFLLQTLDKISDDGLPVKIWNPTFDFTLRQKK